jgi:hypothetical protein
MRERIEELAKKMNTLDGDVYVSKYGTLYKQHVEAITTAVNEALELAARECEKMRHPDDFTPESGQWFLACEDCAAAIRKLKVG